MLHSQKNRNDEERLIFIPSIDPTDGKPTSKKGLRKLNMDDTYDSFKIVPRIVRPSR